VKRVDSKFSSKDRWTAIKVRLGIGRDRYTVAPGLYAIGQPDETSPVFVSANYRLSFDMLRKNLSGISGWILVLDTRGINVWCAAGKGTFGTSELVNRIKSTALADVVDHRNVIVPQLGAPGVAAHTVREKTGFSVIWGPVRAADISAFLSADQRANQEMRRVHFTFRDRFVLTMVEFTGSIRFSAIILAVLTIIAIIAKWNEPFYNIILTALISFIPYFGAVVTGTILFPLLLPILPGRAFSFKGWVAGLFWVLIYGVIYSLSGCALTWQNILPAALIAPPITAFITLNFTGASTFTSLSGVVKEMRLSMPAIIGSAAMGVIALVLGTLVFA